MKPVIMITFSSGRERFQPAQAKMTAPAQMKPNSRDGSPVAGKITKMNITFRLSP